MSEEFYVVEKIVSRRVVDDETEYFIKWAGYPASHNTWEPESNILCDDLLQEFLASLAKKEEKKKEKERAALERKVKQEKLKDEKKDKKAAAESDNESTNENQEEDEPIKSPKKSKKDKKSKKEEKNKSEKSKKDGKKKKDKEKDSDYEKESSKTNGKKNQEVDVDFIEIEEDSSNYSLIPENTSKAGWDHHDEVEELLGLKEFIVDGRKVLMFFVKWKGKEVCTFVPTYEANERIPSKVIEFYESRICNAPNY